MHRDMLKGNTFPSLTWEDVKDELYGAKTSLFYPGLKWGGMTSDISVCFKLLASIESYVNQFLMI